MDAHPEVLATGHTGVRFDVDQQAVDAMEHGVITPARRFLLASIDIIHRLPGCRWPVAAGLSLVLPSGCPVLDRFVFDQDGEIMPAQLLRVDLPINRAGS
jgi:hypothetical protein